MKTKKLTKTQQRVWDAMGTPETRRLMYFPPSFMTDGHFRLGTAPGRYARVLFKPAIPYTTVGAMAKAGVLEVVETFPMDATGRKAYVYKRAGDET